MPTLPILPLARAPRRAASRARVLSLSLRLEESAAALARGAARLSREAQKRRGARAIRRARLARKLRALAGW